MSQAVIETVLSKHPREADRANAALREGAPRWLHRWAIFTVVATILLLGLGSAVTTFNAGMADRVWPTAPTALLSASGEQLGLRSGMTWLLIAPILPGPVILCVPYIVMSFVGG